MWILIFAISMGTAGPAMVSQEYDSEQTCKAARNELAKSPIALLASCTKK